MSLVIHPASRLSGSIQLPGDKSISHRYAILGALARGTTSIENFSSSEDCAATLDCIRALGVRVARRGDRVDIESPGREGFRPPSQPLDMRNSGTGMRLLAGVLAGCPFRSRIVGDESLSRRPMGRIIRPLSLMGARIQGRAGDLPPLEIQGTRLRGIRYRSPVASAQVKSCVLLAGLSAEGETEVEESTASRNHTELALPFFGADFRQDGLKCRVVGGSPLGATKMIIPGDFSGAVFFIVAALMRPGSRVVMRGVGVNPTRSALLDLLERCGVPLGRLNPRYHNGEPVCDLEIAYRESVLQNFPSQLSGDRIPNLIDELPALAVLGTALKNGLHVREAGELRHKECDRIRALCLNLRALGVRVDEQDDGFKVFGEQTIGGGEVQSFGDHRIAMAFAVAALSASSPVRLDDAESVAVSFPDFFVEMDRLRSAT